MTTTEITAAFPLEGRWIDWNRTQYEIVSIRTMDDVINAALISEPYGTFSDGRTEHKCPLCHGAYLSDDLPTHVGSIQCARNLLDMAVEEAIQRT